jgi:hypothetical protein
VPNPPSRFRLRRWLLNLTLDDVAEQTGIPAPKLSLIERGYQGGGTPEERAAIERVLEAAPEVVVVPPPVKDKGETAS